MSIPTTMIFWQDSCQCLYRIAATRSDLSWRPHWVRGYVLHVFWCSFYFCKPSMLARGVALSATDRMIFHKEFISFLNGVVKNYKDVSKPS